VQKAQLQITSEFSLDKPGVGIVAARAQLVHRHYEAKQNRCAAFQERYWHLERWTAAHGNRRASTTHGRLFEKQAVNGWRRLVQPAGDVFEVVSNTTANIPRSKTGELVITLSDDSAAPGARIVIRPRRMPRYRLKARWWKPMPAPATATRASACSCIRKNRARESNRGAHVRTSS